jgi:hypothetical protein
VIYAAIADWAGSDAYPVDFMCRQLGVSRSGYYKWRGRRPSARERAGQTLRQLVKELFAVLNRPGVRRLWAELRVRGWQVSKKRVWRLMRLCQLAGRHPRTRKKNNHPVGSAAGRAGSGRPPVHGRPTKPEMVW